MTKRNICLMNDSFPPVIDGVANAVTNYARNIQKDYGTATVVTPYYPNADDSDFPFEVIRYPSLDLTKLVGYRAGNPISAETMQTLEEKHFDLIHSHCPVASTVLARLVRDRIHVPLIFTYHTKFDIDIAHAIRAKWLQEAAVRTLVENISACDEVWTVSRGAGENLRSLGYAGDCIVMPNGVDFDAGRVPDAAAHAVGADLDLPEGVPVFLFVGRLMWYKGLRIILDAMKLLKDGGYDFRMVFVGKGTDGDEIKAYAKELSLGDKVFFAAPAYDRDVVRAWYCRADLFLFPSTFDTNGLVVREAAACGLASVLIAGSCAAEDITDGKNGFFIEENAASMAALLKSSTASARFCVRSARMHRRRSTFHGKAPSAVPVRAMRSCLKTSAAGSIRPMMHRQTNFTAMSPSILPLSTAPAAACWSCETTCRRAVRSSRKSLTISGIAFSEPVSRKTNIADGVRRRIDPSAAHAVFSFLCTG